MGEDDDEESCSCYAKNHSDETCPPVQNVTHPLRYYEFTQDEIKALEECDKESFYNRCLPFSTVFATLTYAAIKYDFLARNPHFGFVPKMLLAIFCGHVYGRLSYMAICDEKLRRLPRDSHLGNIMRKHYLDNNPAPQKK